MKELTVEVGIMTAKEICFVLQAPYLCGTTQCEGEQTASTREGKVYWNGRLFEELLFVPLAEMESSFELADVTIGVNFHWERKECQRFPGALKLEADTDGLIAINCVPVETYLTSVISSEMSASASLELLKAHAVISRSWLLNIMEHNKQRTVSNKNTGAAVVAANNPQEHIVWYDHQAHRRFDVCADDHCQRYQGTTRMTNPNVIRAVEETWGEVLTSDGKICDARFSKCCGGVMEEFRYCWEDKEVSYLKAARDGETGESFPDLTLEPEAQKWIRTSPDAFCRTADKQILAQVLNNYDRETSDFFRWKVEYTTEELSEIVKRRSGIDFGEIIELQPLERGKSGRLSKLRIVGSKRTVIVGKELEIRRFLSSSHLYSSAFVVDKEKNCFILTGAGWGHGVGLCQIGAAMMGCKGYKYDEILLHYYPGATIDKLYEK